MKYITTYFATLFTLISAIVIFNWFIDPFGMYWSSQVSGLNVVKPEAEKRSRITKAYRAPHVQPQILIVGNSRVEMGISPQHRQFKNKRVYNQGMPGAGLAMQINYALSVIKQNRSLEQIVLSVDYLDFLIDVERSHHVNDSTSSTLSYQHRLEGYDSDKTKLWLQTKEKVGLVFSIDALKASLTTLSQQSSQVSSITKLGFNTADSYIPMIKNEGIIPLFKQKLNWLDQRLKREYLLLTSDNPAKYSSRFEHLLTLLSHAKERNIKVTMFITPYHYSYLQVLNDNNHWQKFLRWKASLVNFLYATDNQQEVPLWDFSGFNIYTLEKTPIATPKVAMKWYWEPAHYRKELGDKMVDIMLDTPPEQHMAIKLTTDNIQEVLTRDQQGLNSSQAQWQILKNKLE